MHTSAFYLYLQRHLLQCLACFRASHSKAVKTSATIDSKAELNVNKTCGYQTHNFPEQNLAVSIIYKRL